MSIRSSSTPETKVSRLFGLSESVANPVVHRLTAESPSKTSRSALRRKSGRATPASLPRLSRLPSRSVQRLVLLMVNTCKIGSNRKGLVRYSNTFSVANGVNWLGVAFNLPLAEALAMLQLLFEARIVSRVTHSPSPLLSMPREAGGVGGLEGEGELQLMRLFVHEKGSSQSRFTSDAVLAKVLEVETMLQRLSPQEFGCVTDEELHTLAEVERRKEDAWAKTKERLLGAKASSNSFHMPIVKSVEFLKALRDSDAAGDPDRATRYNYVIEVLSSGSFSVGRKHFFENTEEAQQARELMTQYSLKHYYSEEPSDDSSNGMHHALGVPGTATRRRSLSAEQRLDTLTTEEKAVITDELIQVELQKWGFNTLAFAQKHQRPIYYLGLALFQKFDLPNRCHIPLARLRSFLSAVESHYQNNKYHNNVHGADVAVSMCYFLQGCGLAELMDNSPDDILAAILAALIHDVDHPGLNNNFVMVTNHELALVHNDQSVLENHHLHTAFAIMADSSLDADILAGLDSRRRRQVRDTVIQLVLATDFSKHFDFLAEFEAKAAAEAGFDMENREDRVLLLSLALKAADIGHTAKPREQHLTWSKSILQEFFMQGEKERALGLPVSNNMDGKTTDIGKSQSGFIKFLVTPLLALWAKQSAQAEPLVELAKDNMQHWDNLSSETAEAIREEVLTC